MILRAGIISGYDAELGGYVDDGAAACFPHFRDGCFRAEEDALAVDVHYAVPVLNGCVLDQTASTADPSVVDEDVQRAEARYGLGDRVIPVGFAGYIKMYEEAIAATLVDFGFNAAPLLVEDIADCDLRALPCEQSGFLRAHASCAAADECHLVVESAHCSASLSRFQGSGIRF